jgi:hypothetical protein
MGRNDDISLLRAELAEAIQEQERFAREARDSAATAGRALRELSEVRALIARMRPVLEYVSRGRGYVGVEPYPDATARFALGALDDAAHAAAPQPDEPDCGGCAVDEACPLDAAVPAAVDNAIRGHS